MYTRNILAEIRTPIFVWDNTSLLLDGVMNASIYNWM